MSLDEMAVSVDIKVTITIAKRDGLTCSPPQTVGRAQPLIEQFASPFEHPWMRGELRELLPWLPYLCSWLV